MDTLLSVIIPTHRRLNLLRQAVDSVLRQTVRPDEIIIVEDDKVIDYSNLKHESWSGQVELLSLPGLGSGAARNFGAGHAGGRYLAFLDDDDLWKPEKLEIQLSVFEKYPHVDLVFCDGFIFSEPGRFVGRFQDNKGVVRRAPWFKTRDGVNLVNSGLGINEIFCGIAITSSIMVRRSLFEKIGGFDGSLGAADDVDLVYRANSAGFVAYVDSPLFEYRLTSSSLSRNLEKSFLDTLNLLRKWTNPDISRDKLKFIKCERRKSLSSIAYLLFSQDRLDEARHWYEKSLRERPRLIDMVYFFGTYFGRHNVSKLRALKHFIAKRV